VAIAYSKPGVQCLLDAQLYLPREWADDPQRRKKTTFPTTSSSRPSPRSGCN
jgi:SRSO17 transposase